MKVNFKEPILGLDGNPIPDNNTGGDLTLGMVCSRSLIASDVEDADEKMKRGSLAIKIYDSEEPMALKVEEVSLLKEVVSKMWSPLIVARAFPLLDENEG